VDSSFPLEFVRSMRRVNHDLRMLFVGYYYYLPSFFNTTQLGCRSDLEPTRKTATAVIRYLSTKRRQSSGADHYLTQVNNNHNRTTYRARNHGRSNHKGAEHKKIITVEGLHNPKTYNYMHEASVCPVVHIYKR